MVRSSRIVALSAVLAAVVATGGYTMAQRLPRLHVLSLTMRSDTQAPRIGRPFHLIIGGRLAERVESVDFLILPNLAELEPLGDERRAITSSRGTEFSETLTVAPRRAGRVHVGGVYFDAIDARDGKPKRYYSNDLTLTIADGSQTRSPVASLTSFLMKLAAALLVIFAGGALLRRRRVSSQPLPTPKPSASVAVPPASPREELLWALEALKRERNRAAVMHARSELWKAAGARAGETLRDLLAHNGTGATLQGALQMTERAAFIDEDCLRQAIEAMIGALEKELA